MKNNIKKQILMILFVLTATILNGCKKDETTSKKDPVINWENPADITVGTLLSAIQLNATADDPGVFVYSPTIGTKLNVGANQDLKVYFIPTDFVTYNLVSKTVKINVIQTAGSGIIFNLNLTYGTMADQDGNTYKTITIGTQTWLAENLKVTHFRNGEPIPNVTYNAAWVTLSTSAYCWYNNAISNKVTYGALYNWFTVVDSRNIAPAGWHVPTHAEWTELITYLGGISGGSGNKMKEAGATHWYSPNTGATNESGFTALPSGYRDNYSTFSRLGGGGNWWSSDAFDASDAWESFLVFEVDYCVTNFISKQSGLAVRLLKD